MLASMINSVKADLALWMEKLKNFEAEKKKSEDELVKYAQEKKQMDEDSKIDEETKKKLQGNWYISIQSQFP